MTLQDGTPDAQGKKATRKSKSEAATNNSDASNSAAFLGALSAQVHVDVLAALDSAAKALGCERSDVIREAARFFVRMNSGYDGEWSFSEAVLDDMPFAAKPVFSNRKLYG